MAAGQEARRLDADEIRAWLVRNIAASIEVDAEEIAVDTPFSDFGLSSMEALRLSGELGVWLGTEISATIAWYYPTIDELAQHLAAS